MKISKSLIILPLILSLLGGGLVYAQADELPAAGLTPRSPFYFLKRAFENLGTLLTFGEANKAQRYLNLAERRLAEAQVLAEDGDERARVALKIYERQVERAAERAARSGDADAAATVAEATTKHLSVLDRVIEQVPEQAKEAVRMAKASSVKGQVSALRALAQQEPERAVDIFGQALEARADALRARAADDVDEEEAEDVESDVEEFKKYAEFGREISEIAQGIRVGDATVEELVERATTFHLRVLEDVSEKAPAEAQEGIQRAIEDAKRVQELRPAIPAPVPTRGVPAQPVETGVEGAAAQTGCCISNVCSVTNGAQQCRNSGGTVDDSCTINNVGARCGGAASPDAETPVPARPVPTPAPSR